MLRNTVKHMLLVAFAALPDEREQLIATAPIASFSTSIGNPTGARRGHESTADSRRDQPLGP